MRVFATLESGAHTRCCENLSPKPVPGTAAPTRTGDRDAGFSLFKPSASLQ